MKDTNTLILAVLGALVIGGAGFFAGRHTNAGYGNNWAMGNQASMRAGFGRGGMMDVDTGARGGGRMGKKGMGNAGEITKIDGSTLTLKYADDTVKEVTLSSDVVVNTMTKGTVKDLSVGQTVMITGGGFWNPTETVIVRP